MNELRRVEVNGHQIYWEGWFHRFADVARNDRVVTVALVENDSGMVEIVDIGSIHWLKFKQPIKPREIS